MNTVACSLGDVDEQVDDLGDLRMEALADFRTFMFGLDEQPGAYSLDEFVKGSASAMRVS